MSETVVSIQDALMSRDCAAPSCPREAESGSDLCRLCRKLTAKDAIASVNGGMMTTIVASAVCKIDGCEDDAVDRVGPYARLCATHKQARRTAAGSAPRSTRSGGGCIVV